tara:strand:+ start:1502 stop:3577 length:2076 start_codon:yes stop_codon:yes gene_type:complete
MSTGPNQILIKRSDVAGVVPSGLSFGEPAINSADGVLFLSQQTEGSATSDLWEFRGFTNEGFVTSVNGSTGAVTAISSAGLSNSTGFNDITGLAFASTTDGLTLSITKHGNTAAISIDADSLASNIGDMQYIFTQITGALNNPTASSNGQMIYNPDNLKLSFFKFGKNGEDYTTILNEANDLGSGQIQFTHDHSTSDRTFIFYYDHDALSFDGTKFDLSIYGSLPDGFTAGSFGSGGVTDISGSRPVRVTMIPDGGRVAASRHFRLPEGSTFGTVITKFNGITGNIDTNALNLHVAGISSNGGITVGSDIQFGGNHNILNSSGNSLVKFEGGTNLNLGDNAGAGNSNKIKIRDSHDTIYIQSSSVRFNDGSKLINDSDTDTHIHFAGGNVKNLVAGGITYAQGTVNGLVAPVGLSAAGGVTFADNVSVGATLSVSKDIVIGNGNDLISDGSSSFQIIQNGNQVALFDDSNGLVRFPIYSVQIEDRLTHSGDSDTFLQFATNEIKLSAGANVGLDMDATNTTIDGVTFDSGVITTSGNLTVAGTSNLGGLTVGAGGITFADGTNQSTASSGGGGGTTDFVAGVVVDGAGSVVTTGSKGYRRLPSGCTLTNVFCIGDTGGTCEFHVMRSSGGDIGGSTVGVTGITAGGITNENTNLAGFSTSYATGDLLEFFVVGTPAKITRASVFMTFEKGG